MHRHICGALGRRGATREFPFLGFRWRGVSCRELYRGMVRIGTLNVRTARGGNLEAALKGCEEMHLDIVVLTETHLYDDKYTRRGHGFEVHATKPSAVCY